MGRTVYVIQTKAGMWRAVQMTYGRYCWWKQAYAEWWERKGNRLAISPEMWVEK